MKKTNSQLKVDTFLDSDGSVISDSKTIINKFCDYFASNYNYRPIIDRQTFLN
jgi:hypothetical protein